MTGLAGTNTAAMPAPCIGLVPHCNTGDGINVEVARIVERMIVQCLSFSLLLMLLVRMEEMGG